MDGGLKLLACRLLWLAACFWLMVQPVVAQPGFEPGRQSVYPYYFPDDDLTGAPLPTPNYSSSPSPITTPNGTVVGGGHRPAEKCTYKGEDIFTPSGYTVRYDYQSINAAQTWVSFKNPLENPKKEGGSIKVHSDISGTVSRLINGLNNHLKNYVVGDPNNLETKRDFMGAEGKRDFCQQVRLRIINRWATGPQDIQGIFYKTIMPDDAVPTATPGNSRHEIGKAVDFLYLEGDTYESRGRGSKLIRSQSESAFIWLKDELSGSNPPLKNFDKEPWHWSVDGR